MWDELYIKVPLFLFFALKTKCWWSLFSDQTKEFIQIFTNLSEDDLQLWRNRIGRFPLYGVKNPLIYEAKYEVMKFETFLSLCLMRFSVENWHTKSQEHKKKRPNTLQIKVVLLHREGIIQS